METIAYVCPKCGRPHSAEEFSESRFCRNCGRFLTSRDRRTLGHDLVRKEEVSELDDVTVMREPKDLDKLVELRQLVDEIQTCLKCYTEFEDMEEQDRIKIRDWYLQGPWFFPPNGSGVKGFFGTGDVTFICPRPSTGGFDDPASKLFYRLLREHGFTNAHITDMVKCRSKAGKMSGKEIRNCLKFLVKEVEILQPRTIVAVGNDVYNELKGRFRDVIKVLHYSAAFRWNKAEILEEQLEEISQRRSKQTQRG